MITASYGFLNAYDRFVTPVSPADQTRFYAEGEPVARLYGVQTPLRSSADFMPMMEALAPRFEFPPDRGRVFGHHPVGQGRPRRAQDAAPGAGTRIGRDPARR